MIDTAKIKDFWDARGKKFGCSPSEEMANLEADPELLALKIKLEQEAVLPRLNLGPDMDVLDLGAGYGQWAFRFAPRVRSVTAVEFSLPMLESGIAEAKRRALSNISFVHCAAEDFTPFRLWPLVFISGLFMYLNDVQAERVAKRAVESLAPGGRIFLRESVSLIGKRYSIDDRWSQAAQANYSALYRMPEEFQDMFVGLGLQPLEHGNMFPDGCRLNKWSETRLRFYVFEKPETIHAR